MSVESYRSVLGSDLGSMVSAFDYISQSYELEKVAVQIGSEEASIICEGNPEPDEIEEQFLNQLRCSQMPPEGVCDMLSVKSIISSGKSYENTTGIEDVQIEGRAEVTYYLSDGSFEIERSDNPAKYSTEMSWEEKLEQNLRIAEQKL